MADLGFDYNAEDHKPMDSFEPVPPDKYEAMIVESEVKDTASGTGKGLSLKWKIISGEYENRIIFDYVNLQNANPQATEIGQRQLSSICRAVGNLKINDSAELHDIPCILDVKVQPAGNDKKGVRREAQNRIKGYMTHAEASGELSPAPTQPARPTASPKPNTQAASRPAPAMAGGGSSPPWKRR